TQYSEPVDLYFYDKKGVLGNVFLMTDVPSSFVGLIAKPSMMGIYVYNKLVANYAFNRQMLFEHLEQFFINYNSPDGNSDSFEELGQYYRFKVTRGGQDEAPFYSDLNQRLLNDEIGDFSVANLASIAPGASWSALLANKLTNWLANHFRLIGDAYAQEAGSCPAGLAPFMKFTGVVFDFFPVPLASSVLEATTILVEESCDGTGDQLSEIYTQIQEMNNRLSNVEGAVAEVKALLETSIINNETKSFEQALVPVKEAVAIYNDIKGAGTFKEYVKSQGGLSKAMSVTKVAKLIDSVQGGTDSTSIFVTLGQKVTVSGMNNLAAALQSECGNEATMQGDIVAKRTGCNLAITTVVSYLAATHGNAAVMLKDVYDTLAAYPLEADGIPKPAGVTQWSTAYATVKQQFDGQMNLLIGKFMGPATGAHKGFYIPLQGLPDQLKNRLVEVNCALGGAKGETAVPNITGWFGGPNGNDAYIVTHCRLGADATGHQFTSRYYFGSVAAQGGLTPVNMMGVPIASGMLNQGSLYGSWTTNESASSLGLVIPVSLSGASSANTFALSVAASFIQPKSNIYVPSYSTSSCEFRKFPWSALPAGYDLIRASGNGGCADGSNEDFFRYTNNSGYSYVFKFKTALPNDAIELFYMGCLSAGCSVVNNNHRLSFEDGPKNIWFFKPFKEGTYGFEVDNENLFPN
ncbi:MAG: hypothetical protein ACR2IJ_07210, partial [Fluviibacter sp.]